MNENIATVLGVGRWSESGQRTPVPGGGALGLKVATFVHGQSRRHFPETDRPVWALRSLILSNLYIILYSDQI